jgi:hypothetical protein
MVVAAGKHFKYWQVEEAAGLPEIWAFSIGSTRWRWT